MPGTGLEDKPFAKRGPQKLRHQIAAGGGAVAIVGYLNYLLLSSGTIDQVHASFLGPAAMAGFAWLGTLVRNVTTEFGLGRFLPALLAALLLASPVSPIACASVTVERPNGEKISGRVFGASQWTTCPTVVADSPGVPNLVGECVTITGGTISDNGRKAVGGVLNAVLSPVLGILSGGLSGLAGVPAPAE